MRPVLFRWGGRAVHSYPALAWLGLCVALVAQDVAAHAAGLDAPRVWLASLLLVPLAFIGARLLYAATHRGPGRLAWRRSQGGMSMYGGLPAMVLASLPLLALLGVPIRAYWDTAIIAILAGMPVVRVGCLLHGCCAGRVWGVPVQVAEMALGLALLVGAVALAAQGPPPGAVFLAGVGGYALGRLALQPLRAERSRSGMVISGALLAGAVLTLALGLAAGP